MHRQPNIANNTPEILACTFNVGKLVTMYQLYKDIVTIIANAEINKRIISNFRLLVFFKNSTIGAKIKNSRQYPKIAGG